MPSSVASLEVSPKVLEVRREIIKTMSKWFMDVICAGYVIYLRLDRDIIDVGVATLQMTLYG
jgi:hypothetical protein